MRVIISSWKKRVEKGTKGNDYENDRHDATNNASRHAISNTNLKSTGKGAKKRRAAVVLDDADEAEDADDEDD